jgi:ubiquinone/menaquinone biosynthesis C-methylase UbiE
MESWLSYWDTPNKSYVSERHKKAHYDVVFDGIRRHLPTSTDGIVLDWGCGDALAAERIAELCGGVLLYDAAASTRERLDKRFRRHTRICILNDTALEGLPGGSIDLIVVNSVIQYLSAEQFDYTLALFCRLLSPSGAVLLGDIISPETGNSQTATTFLRFAWRKGFLLSAIAGLVQTFASPYRMLQRRIGLAAYTPFQMLQILERHGFVAEQLPCNIAVSPHRSAYLARKNHTGQVPKPHRFAAERERGTA